MIADASCRVVTPLGYDGFDFYRNRARTESIIAAYASLPSTAGPSHFTLMAHTIFSQACSVQPNATTIQDQRQCNIQPLPKLTSSMDAWHRALCASKNDPAWNDNYDPAYQPQQVALTAGFMCIVSCDCANTDLSSKTLNAFAASDEMTYDVQKNLCAALPYHSVNFTKQATSADLLSQLSKPLRSVCGCEQ